MLTKVWKSRKPMVAKLTRDWIGRFLQGVKYVGRSSGVLKFGGVIRPVVRLTGVMNKGKAHRFERGVPRNDIGRESDPRKVFIGCRVCEPPIAKWTEVSRLTTVTV